MEKLSIESLGIMLNILKNKKSEIQGSNENIDWQQKLDQNCKKIEEELHNRIGLIS